MMLIMGSLYLNAQATSNIMGNVVVEYCNFYGRIVVYRKCISGYVFGPMVNVTFKALSYSAVDLQYNGYLDNIAIIVGAAVPVDLGISDMGGSKWLNQVSILYFAFYLLYIWVFLFSHHLSHTLLLNFGYIEDIPLEELKGSNPNFVESACVGLSVQVYTDLIEYRNLPSMPVIKDVTINGGL